MASGGASALSVVGAAPPHVDLASSGSIRVPRGCGKTAVGVTETEASGQGWERIQTAFRPVLDAVAEAAQSAYGARMVALAVYGSVGRGTARPDSDVDLLIVARGLPEGRTARVAEFDPVERAVPAADLSPVIKSPEALAHGFPLLLDMVDDAVILYDPEGVLAARLQALRDRLRALGARRVPYRGAWYWDLKPDFRPGDVIEL